MPQDAARAEPAGVVRTTPIITAVNKEVDLMETISADIQFALYGEIGGRNVRANRGQNMAYPERCFCRVTIHEVA